MSSCGGNSAGGIFFRVRGEKKSGRLSVFLSGGQKIDVKALFAEQDWW